MNPIIENTPLSNPAAIKQHIALLLQTEKSPFSSPSERRTAAAVRTALEGKLLASS